MSSKTRARNSIRVLIKLSVVLNSIVYIHCTCTFCLTIKSECSDESSIGAEEGGGADGPGRDGSDRRRECRRRRRCDRYFLRHRTLSFYSHICFTVITSL